MSRLLYIIDTNYRPDIMAIHTQPELIMERAEFMRKVNQKLPREVGYPIVSIGYEEGNERWWYFIGGSSFIGGKRKIAPYINAAFIPLGTPEKAASFLNDLLTGEHEKAREVNNDKVILADHLVNTAPEHFERLLGLLESRHGYKRDHTTIER